ncbi:MAG TPA: nucleoside-triphosphatase [Methanomicrobiales archaeon]|jgi:nucleoside-triphosphatase|nr:nucleoside-triphosphatase [Methanomicrobiales archaeon]
MKNLLVTGPPGCGKTTLVRRIVHELGDLTMVGFYTEEIREGRDRVGFALVGLDGKKGILSHVRFPGPHRVGKYGVDIMGFESFLDGIRVGDPGLCLVVIDEIGKMECISARFRSFLGERLAAPVPLLATIALRGMTPIEQVKARPDVRIITMSVENREERFREVLAGVRRLIGEKKD